MSQSKNTTMIFNEIFKSDEIFRRFFHDSPIGMSITLADGSIHVNPAFANMLGYTREEHESLNWRDITHPDDIERSEKAVQALISNGRATESFEKRYIHKDGHYVWVEIHSSLYHTPEGKDVFLTTIFDITDRKKAEIDLEESRAVYFKFLNSSHDMIFLKNNHFEHLLANNALCQFYGKNRQDIIGKTDVELMDPDAALRCRETDELAFNSDTLISAVETIGDKIYETRKFSVQITEEEKGVGAFIRDITMEHNQREKIEKISETYRLISECLQRPFNSKQEHLDYAMHQALTLTGSLYGYVYYYNEETEEFNLNSWSENVRQDCDIKQAIGNSKLAEIGLWGDVVRKRKAIIVNRYQEKSPNHTGYPKGHIHVKRFLSVPIFEGNRIVAVVGVANKATDYNAIDVQAITILMTGVWNSIGRREKEHEMAMLFKQTQSMFEEHQAVMLLIDPEAGQIINANPAATEFYGYTKDELLKMKIQDINMLPKKDISRLLTKTASVEKGARYWTFPHRLKNGRIRMVDVYSSPIPYEDKTVLYSIMIDVTDREKAYSDIQYISYHDYLTGLHNRRYFEEEYKKLNHKENYPLGIIMGDVNGLKLVNDSLGHNFGDTLLEETSRILTKKEIDADIVARVGGDEFALMFIRTSENELRDKVRRLESLLKQGNKGTDSSLILSIAFGYAVEKKSGEPLQNLMKEAEGYLYANKYYDDTSVKGRTIDLIMNTLFEKSERERAHSQRVAKIATLIAEVYDFSPTNLNKIRTAGLLHDIGKIGIDEKILNKVGRLDEKEWQVMKTHVERSYRILQNSIEFSDICDFVRSHHERWDGGGYPQGLKGDQIPLESRIICLADAYDAMTNKRTYQDVRPKKEAIKEILDCKGTQFDPGVVNAFMTVIDKGVLK